MGAFKTSENSEQSVGPLRSTTTSEANFGGDLATGNALDGDYSTGTYTRFQSDTSKSQHNVIMTATRQFVCDSQEPATAGPKPAAIDDRDTKPGTPCLNAVTESYLCGTGNSTIQSSLAHDDIGIESLVYFFRTLDKWAREADDVACQGEAA